MDILLTTFCRTQRGGIIRYISSAYDQMTLKPAVPKPLRLSQEAKHPLRAEKLGAYEQVLVVVAQERVDAGAPDWWPTPFADAIDFARNAIDAGRAEDRLQIISAPDKIKGQPTVYMVPVFNKEDGSEIGRYAFFTVFAEGLQLYIRYGERIPSTDNKGDKYQLRREVILDPNLLESSHYEGDNSEPYQSAKVLFVRPTGSGSYQAEVTGKNPETKEEETVYWDSSTTQEL